MRFVELRGRWYAKDKVDLTYLTKEDEAYKIYIYIGTWKLSTKFESLKEAVKAFRQFRKDLEE